MRLPNADRAVIDMRKLTDYVLNTEHRKGGDKAYMFEKVLGITTSNAEFLRDMLLNAVITYDAIIGICDEYGQRYTVYFPLRTDKGEATIRSGWIIRPDEDFPRLATCFVDD